MRISDGIIPVSEINEQEWLALALTLWPDANECDLMKERNEGHLKNEFLYYLNNKAVAFISLSLRHDYVEGTDSSPVGYIEGIFVEQNYRRNGIAKELVDFAKNWSVANGCVELASDCLLENEDSRIFHNRIGFREANTIVCFTMDLSDKPELS